jgi:virginiamycin A acetyltransferase
MITIASDARVSPLADIEDSTRGTRIEIGPRVVVDSFVKIKPAGGSGDLLIGSDTTINSGCVLYTGNGIQIGRGCAIGANCTFAPVNHAYLRRALTIREQRFAPSKGGIVIGDDVWIGANCVLLDGALIPDGCVIGAGSLVRGRLDPYGVYVGNPLVKRGERSDGPRA